MSLTVICLGATARAGDDVLIADFEGTDYATWTSQGDAFGDAPAHGTLPGQMHVEGFIGKGLVNSFRGGDDATGTLKSPPFQIERNFITFLIGGGGWANETCMNLVVDGKVVRTAAGPNTDGGDSERLAPLAWDVTDLRNREARLIIIDQRKGGWGHINVDHIVQTDDRGSVAIAVPPVATLRDVARELTIHSKWLLFPIKSGGKSRVVTIAADGVPTLRFDMELADDHPEWWAPLDVSHLIGKKAQIKINFLSEDSQALKSIQQADKFVEPSDLYRESLRSQFHFSPKQGWTNDPNGLVYFRGEYHLFFQHNPYGWNWGNMHWGHATSNDLVHWVEHGDVLAPDDLGPMFSGSAVVDWNNTSGFGNGTEPPLVLIYTAAGNPTTQCLAYSHDGRTLTKYSANPIIPQISGGNRDPKVFWHAPSKQWILVLYVEIANKQHSIHFFKSPNLKEWELLSVSQGGIDADKYLYECPDLFELAIDGDQANRKWILNAANSHYAVGSFDGHAFRPEASKLVDVRGQGFYAAQTFSDIADGRRIQIGWQQAPSPGMAFNQLQSIPSELTLRSTADGPRLCRTPVKELKSLRKGGNRATAVKDFRGELIELRAEFEPGDAKSIEFHVRGAKIAYDVVNQLVSVNGSEAPAPLIDGKQSIIVYVDKTVLEVFASGGLTYVPFPFIPKPADQSVSIEEKGGRVKMKTMELFELESMWNRPKDK